MRTIGENIDKTAFTFSARKKKDSIFLKFFFENEFVKDMEIYQKKTNWRVRGTLKEVYRKIMSEIHFVGKTRYEDLTETGSVNQ